MLKETIKAQDVSDLLNDLLKLDYGCITSLINNRESCNDAIANHPTVQVQQYIDDKFPKVGLIGILNGLFGIAPSGMGAICFETDGSKVIGFKLTKDAEETPHNAGCLCYSSSSGMDGVFYLIRNDCPVHKGVL